MLQEAPVLRVDTLFHGLEPTRTVLVNHRRDQVPDLGTYPIGLNHERRGVVYFKESSRCLSRDGWTKRPEVLSELDALVQSVFHVLAARIREDTAIPQCAGTKLHASLEPPDNTAAGQVFGSLLDELVMVLLAVLDAGIL